MHRVVVTGIGTINALGHTVGQSWESAINGKTGVAPITLFDTADFPVKVAAEVKDFDPDKMVDRKELRRQDRFQWLAAIATREAVAQSGLEITEDESWNVGVVISSGVGGMDTMIEQIVLNHTDGYSRLNPFTIPKIMSNGAAGMVSIDYGARGPSFSTASACASASDGIGMSIQLIRSGVAHTMITGGAEAAITDFSIGCFERVKAASRALDCTPRPFSLERDGLVMGECAAILILESLDHAKARGAEILAEVIGYGATSDAYHITAPTEDGSGSGAAIRRALSDAQVLPDEVDYINAHGTGTALNDPAETAAIKVALGKHAYRIPISSTKSMTGHCMGATGALEAIFCIQTIRQGVIPPTINFGTRDPKCDLDYVPNIARQHRTRIAVSNSFGFGGHNSVLVMKEFTG